MQHDSLLQLPFSLAQPGSRAPGRFVMGIDGGATKTLAAVLDLESHELHLASAGPSNVDAVGGRAAVQALLDVADQAIARAGIDADQLATAVLAVAGTDTDALARLVRAARSEDWIVVNDVIGAWAAATGARPGVGAISGTGSNVFGVGADGRAWRVGGWGHLLGDEGSGYWLGNESIRAALRDRDGSGPQTALGAAATQFFGTSTVEELAALVYSKPLSKSQIAAFATEACRVAEDGDAIAREVYARGAKELGAQIVAVIARTGLAGGAADRRGGGEVSAFPVGLIGSGFKAGALLVDPLVSIVAEAAPGACVSVVEMAPVGGSLQLAARACGCAERLDTDELTRAIDAALTDAG